MNRLAVSFERAGDIWRRSVAVPPLRKSPARDSAPAAAVSDSFPAWAYPWAPDFKVPPDDGGATHVPDSTATFTVTQERDLFFVPDWHPGDHAPMPDIVARGRRPDVRACGSCHRAEGTGGPENASLAGLSAAYIAQQMADFKSGARKFAGPQEGPVLTMIAIAKAATDAEVQAAAAYFSALKPKPIIKVVEADTVPVTQVARFFYTTVANGGTEPIGRRIVEIPRMSSSSSIATRVRGSRPMFRPAALPRAKRWRKPVDRAQRSLAPDATARASTGSAPFPGSPDARRATSCGRFIISSSRRGTEARAR